MSRVRIPSPAPLSRGRQDGKSAGTRVSARLRPWPTTQSACRRPWVWGGGARLTVDRADYAGAVTRRVRWLGPFVIAAAALAASATPAAACTTDAWIPERLGDVRGFTFVGVFRSLEGAGTAGRYSFDVERVYAGDVHRDAVVVSELCHGIRNFVVGERYLFSASRLDGAQSDSAVAWRIGDERRLSIVGFDLPAAHLDLFAGINTLREALRAVAPGSVAELPDTAVAPTPQRPAPGPEFVAAAVIAAIGAAAAFTRRRRTTGNVGSS
jgi:hypothetical protein